MGTIVCAVDDSSEAEEALRTAVVLSKDWGLRLVLVHVESSATLSPLAHAQDERHGRELLNRLASRHRPDGTADRRLEAGDRASQLARVAAEEAASVIVVGSRSRRWWRRSSLGGLAADLTATAACPVVIVPPPARR